MEFDWLDWNSGIFAASSVIGTLVYYLSTKENETIRNLQNAPSVEVGSSLQNILKTNTGNMIPYVAVRGAVKQIGSQTIKSETGHSGVVQMISLSEHSMRRYGNGFWGGSVRQIGTTLNDVPFGLRSPSQSSDMIVEIVDPLQAIRKNLLSTVSTKFAPSSAGFASTVLGYFMGSTTTGIETTEKLLSVDTNITAIGQLSLNSGKLRLSMPMDKPNYPYILSTHPLEHVIDDMISDRRAIRIIAYILYSVATIFAIRKGMKLFKAYELKRMRGRILRDRAERTTSQNERNNGNSDLHICVVCLTNPREVILIPCGHVAVCLDCLERMNGVCPVCRSNYSSTYAAYIS